MRWCHLPAAWPEATAAAKSGRMEAWSSVMFCAGAFFLFYGTAPRDWIAFTLAGGLIIVFTSWRIPREINKLQRNEGGKANK